MDKKLETVSKRYFAKYLPVQCEQLAKQPEGSSCNKNNSCKFPSCTKRLFLCSRNIKVGDKVIPFEYDSFWGYYKKKYDIVRDIKPTDKNSLTKGEKLLILLGPEIKEHGNWFYMDEFFKVIGEISPEASWIKEGDEFDDDQIGIKELITFQSWPIKYLDTILSNYEQRHLRVIIKCPCCNKFQ